MRHRLAVRAGDVNYPPAAWLTGHGWPWPVLADDVDATAFVASGGSTFPYAVLLDAEGIVVARSSGGRPGDEIVAWIEATLAST